MSEVKRPKKVAALRKELADLVMREQSHLHAAKCARERMDEIEAALELLGAPEPGARLGLLFGDEENEDAGTKPHVDE